MNHITFSMVAPAFPFFPVWIAQECGYFEKHGITIEIEITGTTDKVTTSIAEGHSQIGMVSPEGAIGDAAGGRLRLIAGSTNRTAHDRIEVHQGSATSEKKVGTSSLKKSTASSSTDQTSAWSEISR
jgi:ABC-type nitrate/sulfonate/bicarbonate transport system substrate-binding protein